MKRYLLSLAVLFALAPVAFAQPVSNSAIEFGGTDSDYQKSGSAPLNITPAPRATILTGKVLSVSDGDTLNVDVNGTRTRVRLFGVDAPEKDQAWGTESATFLSGLALNRYVEIDVRGIDQYGRTLGFVTVLKGNIVLNRAAVSSGNAWWYKQFAPNNISLRDKQRIARTELRGLWAQPAVAPWDWRQGSRTPIWYP